MDSAQISKIFLDFQEFISQEQDLKEQIRGVIKDLEQQSREILMVLQDIHQNPAQSDVLVCCEKARGFFGQLKEKYSELAAIVPANQFYHYNDMWRFVNQRLTFLISLTIFLETGKLASREQVADILGLEISREKGFHLDLEDYLTGLLHMATELARFATNSVTNGNYERPIEISKFVSELNAGFRLLNLKNDSLRKRFDALKYDVKKIEEVVYDLSIRGLRPSQPTE
ncbi:translin [Neocloeon triangulifer]|uniref:translin n=1 Tax=Neocloeon triangulifer TaxID=2078957 RepID=UPI00286F57A5|nr:translin [Neocloeon triangulifer]